MNKQKAFNFILCFWVSMHFCSWSSEEVRECDYFQNGLDGVNLYEEGRYAEATPLLKEALLNGHLNFSLTYADICRRNLDGANHSREEAAEWYIKGAEAGDGDAVSYLEALSSFFTEEHSFASKVDELVKIWLQDIALKANRGFELYVEGNFSEAAKCLKKASSENHPLAQQFYADICLRQLDGKPHPLKEAAMWYLLSAHGGDSQSYSYLSSISPRIFDNPDYDRQMESIVKKWVCDTTISGLKEISPKDINDFLIFKFDHSINKTLSQKLPYFFDKIVNAFVCKILPVTQVTSVLDEEPAPLASQEEFDGMQGTCAQEFVQQEGRQFTKEKTACFSYGPVYFNYYQSLKGSSLPKPSAIPKIPIIYEFILSSLYDTVKKMKARELSRLSHEEYPWIIAGIKFWKAYHKKSLGLKWISDEDLMEKLSQMTEKIPEEQLREVVDLLEDKKIWSNDRRDGVSKEFSENVKRFFVSPISTESNLVQQSYITFSESLKNHELDCKKKHDLEILQTPFLMFYCETLVLNNLEGNKNTYKSIECGQRHFFHLLKLTVSYDASFDDQHKPGKDIIAIIQKIKKRGLEVYENKEATSDEPSPRKRLKQQL